MVNSAWMLWPGQSCLLCGLAPGSTPFDRAAGLCLDCANDLPRINSHCPRCGLPLVVTQLCGQCQMEPPPYQRCIAPLLYRAPVSHLIARFKYGGQLAYGRLLASELLRRLRCGPLAPVDLIVPVPLHWRRRWTRGFNQAEIVADMLGRALQLPLRTDLIRRTRPTPPQQSLSADERRRNLRRAFAVNDRTSIAATLAGRDIALVDDVVTTGATVAEIAHLLLAAGARSVQVWCLARTP